MFYRISMIMLVSTVLISSAASAANVDVKVNIGGPPVVVREVVPSPPPTRTVIIEDIPEFVYPDPLGFYVAVGVPYDLFYLDGYYYMFRDRKWHRGYDFNGPWYLVREKQVPFGLRKHKLTVIRQHRDREYVIYKQDHNRYRGKHFRPDNEWNERRKLERREYKEERKQDRREFKEERRSEHQELKDDRRHSRDEVRDDRGRGNDDRRDDRDRGRGRDDDRGGPGKSGRDR
jgi:hypothetical protein